MVRQLLTEDRRRVVELWLNGQTYREILAKTGVSLGAISSIVDEERKKAPDIEELRRLNVALREADANIKDAVRGAELLNKLNSWSIPTQKMQECINLLERYGDEAADALGSGLRLKELEASQRKTYKEIVAEAIEKTKHIEEMTERIENLRRDEERTKASLQDLERLRNLDGKLIRHNLTPQRLDSFIEQSIKLQGLGFTPEVAKTLASELQTKGLDAEKSASTLANLLTQHKNIETAVAELQAEKSRLETDIETKRAQAESLREELNAWKIQVESFKRLFENGKLIHQSKVDQLEKEYVSRKERLESQLSDLRRKQEDAMKTVQGLKEEGENVRRSLEEAQGALNEFESKLEKATPLATVALLMEKPQSRFDPETLLKICVGFIEGLTTQIEAHSELVPNPRELKRKLEELSLSLSGGLRNALRKAQ